MNTKITLSIEKNDCDYLKSQTDALMQQLNELGFDASYLTPDEEIGTDNIHITVSKNHDLKLNNSHTLTVDGTEALLEKALRLIPFDFEKLPLLTEGDSKELRLLTDKVVVIRFKPTVYSYTMNRYGEVPQTNYWRLKFTASLYRRMHQQHIEAPVKIASTFLAEIEREDGHYLLENKVESCNLEIRVKRYHIGSPLHRYLYTDKYPTTQKCGPLKKWSKFDEPVVCFDWRHPLLDETGARLADEPISDDYAKVWMHDADYAKEMARNTFLWLEDMFKEKDIRLIDICFFIDKSGRKIYGEISPDCMRVRLGMGDPELMECSDKDLWRNGKSPEELLDKYKDIYYRIFGGRA